MSDQPQDPNDVERILHALAAEDRDDGLPAPDDARLRAWREGRLSEEEAAEMEELLARSTAGRRRLIELADVGTGVDRSLPLRRVRKAVLDGARPGLSRRSWRTAAALAAMLALAVLGVFLRQPALPKGLAYDVSARGLAEARSEEATVDKAGEVRAYPDTTVRIVLRPRGDSPAGLSYALFRREGGGLRRVRVPEEARLDVDRGSASFTGAAARVLATGVPGRYPVFVVISASKRLPSYVENPGDLRSSGRLIYPMTITLLPESLP